MAYIEYSSIKRSWKPINKDPLCSEPESHKRVRLGLERLWDYRKEVLGNGGIKMIVCYPGIVEQMEAVRRVKRDSLRKTSRRKKRPKGFNL